MLALTACGRIGFGEHQVGPSDGPGADAEPSGLLLHLAFESDGILHDRAPAHHDATCATTCPAPATGRVGAGAVDFTGGACLVVADAADLHPAAFTYAVWFRPDVSGIASIFGRAYDGATAGTNTFEAFIDLSDVWKVAVNTTSVNTPIDHGIWHHLAGAFDGAVLTMYVDGIAVGVPQMTGAAVYGPDNLTIGCDFNGGAYSNSATGLIDDVRLYDHLLSPAELQALAGQR